MNDEDATGRPPSLESSDPTNAKLAAMMVEQTGKFLRRLASVESRLEKMIADPLPAPVSPTLSYEELREVMQRALREDRELLPEHSRHLFPSGTRQGEALHVLIDLFAHAIDKELYRGSLEALAGDAVGPVSPDEDEPAEPAIEFTPVSWEEFEERINVALAKSAKKEREMTAMLDAVMEAGLLAASEKGGVAIALAKAFAGMIPDGEPMNEIPDGWAPVALAINPATGEFLTLAGPRSEPDGRVEAVETMLARQLQNAVASTIGAVREAGRPQPKPGKPDCTENVITGPIDEGTCEECRSMIGKRVSPSKTADYLRGIQVRCECVNGCRLTVEHGANRWQSVSGSRSLEEGSEGE